MNYDLPPKNHNNPPVKTAIEYLIDDLKSDTASAERQIEERLADIANMKVVDEDSASRATEVAGQLLRISQELDETRKLTNKPFNEKVAVINSHFNTLKDKALAGKTDAAGYVDAWKKRMAAETAERQAKAAAEAARLRAEVERAAANNQVHGDTMAEKLQEAERLETVATQPAEPAIIRGSHGSSASTRKKSVFTIVDFDAALQHFKDNSLITDALNNAIAAAIRGKQTKIPGVTIDIKETTVIRS